MKSKPCNDMLCVMLNEDCYSISRLLNNEIKKKHAKFLYVFYHINDYVSVMSLYNPLVIEAECENF